MEQKEIKVNINEDELFFLIHRFSSCPENTVEDILRGAANMGEASKRLMEFLLQIHGKYKINSPVKTKFTYIVNENDKKILKKRYDKFFNLLVEGVYSNSCCMIELSPTQPKFVCYIVC